MGRKLLVDTNILIQLERGDSQALAHFRDDDDIAIGSVTRAELLTGPLLANDSALRARRRKTAQAVLAGVTVLDYTAATAAVHAHLLAHVKTTGTPRGAHDLIIAAHARETGRRLVTTDTQARFGDLPGVHTA
ncbi:MAG: PIN domain-containing protein [Cellulomonadaceae bacterium]|nr:PIN domain-containing protein [Cellulomonadaceae bacterium]